MTKKSLKNSSKKWHELTEKEALENILTNEDGDRFTNVAVSVDGTKTECGLFGGWPNFLFTAREKKRNYW